MSNRRTGKIARLPKETRDVVNSMLRDGRSYESIRSEVGDLVADVNDQNFTNWSQGGYLEWLKEQERLDDMRFKREFALSVVKENEGSQVHEAATQIASSQIYEVLMDLDPTSIKEKLQESPEQYSRLINALAKLSDSGLKYERYRAEVAERKSKIEKELKTAKGEGGLTAETLSRIEQELKLL